MQADDAKGTVEQILARKGPQCLKILLAGLSNIVWHIPRSWSMVQSPLADAGTLTEYDLVIIKPSLFGGIFDAELMTRYTEYGYGVKVWDSDSHVGRYLQNKLEDLVPRMTEIGWLNRLVIIPSSEWTLYYREPKILNSTVANLNRAIGRPEDNYTSTRTVCNLDLLNIWGVQVQNDKHGNSAHINTPGHPVAKYLSLQPMFWEVTYEVNAATQRILASDSVGIYSVAFDAEVNSSRLIVVPEVRHEDGLTTLAEGMQELTQWYSSLRIRSGTEREALEKLTSAYRDLDTARQKLAEAHQIFRESARLSDERLANEPILASALEDYHQGLLHGRPEGMAFFYRAWERLKKHYGQGEKEFMGLVGINNKDRVAITKPSNDTARHAPLDNPARRPSVSSDEFEDARRVLQIVLERYSDYLYNKHN